MCVCEITLTYAIFSSHISLTSVCMYCVWGIGVGRLGLTVLMICVNWENRRVGGFFYFLKFNSSQHSSGCTLTFQCFKVERYFKKRQASLVLLFAQSMKHTLHFLLLS